MELPEIITDDTRSKLQVDMPYETLLELKEMHLKYLKTFGKINFSDFVVTKIVTPYIEAMRDSGIMQQTKDSNLISIS